jgi:hypothetical protein|tara:strand:- start:791 stop:1303 length:513 start_codon:yes stop_codon:yes gene_type:complete
MNIKFYFEKLFSSDEFKNFMKENPDAYLCSGFFVIDREDSKKNDNKIHFDFFLEKEKKMFSFQLEDGIKLVPLEKIDDKIPEKVSDKCEFEFEEIENMIEERMKKENLNNKIQKIMLSLQKIDGEDYIIATVFISMLGMLKVNISLPSKEITEFEKKSFFDIMKVKKKEN